jgi:hypothetical protein
MKRAWWSLLIALVLTPSQALGDISASTRIEFHGDRNQVQPLIRSGLEANIGESIVDGIQLANAIRNMCSVSAQVRHSGS